METFKEGQRVRYVPGHAHGDKGHPDCEDGTVSHSNSAAVFVKFNKHVGRFGWEWAPSKACDPDSLVAI